MALLEVRLYGDPMLRRKAAHLREVTPEMRRLIADMVETMFHQVGIGLAAPQVGIPYRLLVMDDGKGAARALINPVITERSGSVVDEEGCLSSPASTPTSSGARPSPCRPPTRTASPSISTPAACRRGSSSTRWIIWTASSSSITSRPSRATASRRRSRSTASPRRGDLEPSPSSLKVLFYGTPEFALPTLEALLEHHTVRGRSHPARQARRSRPAREPSARQGARAGRGHSRAPAAAPARSRLAGAAGRARRRGGGGGRLRADPAQDRAGCSAARLHQCPRVDPAALPRSRAHRVGHHARRDRDGHHHVPDGSRHGHGRHAPHRVHGHRRRRNRGRALGAIESARRSRSSSAPSTRSTRWPRLPRITRRRRWRPGSRRKTAGSGLGEPRATARQPRARVQSVAGSGGRDAGGPAPDLARRRRAPRHAGGAGHAGDERAGRALHRHGRGPAPCPSRSSRRTARPWRGRISSAARGSAPGRASRRSAREPGAARGARLAVALRGPPRPRPRRGGSRLRRHRARARAGARAPRRARRRTVHGAGLRHAAGGAGISTGGSLRT